MYHYNNIENFVKNKQVFCGIDIHKERWNLCYMCDGQILDTRTISGDFKKLDSHTKHFYSSASKINFVYEAGFSGFYLHRLLTSNGYYCIITPPNRVPQNRDKVKTDRRDAQKLAQYYSAGLLKKVYVPSLSAESDRQILRLRNSYQKKLTRVKNQIKSLLNLHGIKWSKQNGNKWTKRYIAWLNELEFNNDENLRYVLDLYIKEFHFLRDHIADLSRRIRALSRKKPYSKPYRLLVYCKGIGLITAMTYLLELQDIVRFPSANKFCSYIGMTPSQFSSGNHVRLGHISREGNSHLRRVLVESAWTVIRYDPFLREKYDRIKSKGSNGKKAIVAVARSLAVRLRCCLLNEQPYVIGVC